MIMPRTTLFAVLQPPNQPSKMAFDLLIVPAMSAEVEMILSECKLALA